MLIMCLTMISVQPSNEITKNMATHAWFFFGHKSRLIRNGKSNKISVENLKR